MGHELSPSGCRPLKSHVDLIQQWSAPTGVKALRRFLGFVNYYRHFIEGMASICAPLYSLTKKRSVWCWDDNCQASFDKVKAMIMSCPVLRYPDWKEPFVVCVDASTSGVGGMLAQKSEKGELQPISFFSSGLTSAQRNYAAGELEAWALIAALRKWWEYLQAAKKVYFISDHNPLVWMKQKKDPRGKFARWLLELEMVQDYEILYRKGSNNQVADFLSRIPSPVDINVNDNDEHMDRHVYLTEETPLDRIKRGQLKDRSIINAKTQLSSDGAIREGCFRRCDGIHIHDDILMKRNRIIIPEQLKTSLTKEYHSQGHFGVEKTLAALKRDFYWVGMENIVKEICSRCEVCARQKRSYQSQVKMQTPNYGAKGSRQAVAMDIATMPWSADGHRYLLVVVDLFAKFVELIPMADQTATSVVTAFRNEWIYRHGAPRVLVSDQGRNVDGGVVRVLCAELGIQKRHSSPYHPQGDGQAERSVQTAKQTIKCLLDEQDKTTNAWPEVVREAAFHINNAVNSSTGKAPSLVMFGTELRTTKTIDVESLRSDINPDDVIAETKANHIVIQTDVDKRTDLARQRYKQYHDRGRVEPAERKVRPGDEIMLRNENRTGLDPMYSGPHKVLDTRGANVFLDSNRPEKPVDCVHHDRCKKLATEDVPTGTPSEAATALNSGVHCRPPDEGESQGSDSLRFLPTTSRYGRRIQRNRRFADFSMGE